MYCSHHIITKTHQQLDLVGGYVSFLVLRFLLAWEYGEAGLEKLNGTNWFADITFPFPFNLLSADISWNLALTFEIVGALLLVLGLATRFISASLIILTIVAIAAVHWPADWNSISELLKGYRIIDENNDGFGNYKLPLIYMVMFIPLLFNGAGKLSIDYWLAKNYAKKHTKK